MINLITNEQKEKLKKEKKAKLEHLKNREENFWFFYLEPGFECLVILYENYGSTLIGSHESISIYLGGNSSEPNFDFLLVPKESKEKINNCFYLPDEVDFKKLEEFVISSDYGILVAARADDPIYTSLNIENVWEEDLKIAAYFKQLTGKALLGYD